MGGPDKMGAGRPEGGHPLCLYHPSSERLLCPHSRVGSPQSPSSDPQYSVLSTSLEAGHTSDGPLLVQHSYGGLDDKKISSSLSGYK